MKEIDEEIKQTLNLMQTEIDDGAHGELHSHLYQLLEIKRNELMQRLAERSRAEPNLGVDKAKPLTSEELKAGGWWCEDVSEECANAFKSKGLRVFNSYEWGVGSWNCCATDDEGSVTRGFFDGGLNKQIHRIGNEFYWSHK